MNSFCIKPCLAAWMLSVAVILTMPATVAAQLGGPFGGSLYLFSDTDFTDSTYQDQSPQVFSVYVVHSDMTGSAARSVRFKVEASPGITFSWIGETSPWTIVDGDSRTGIYVDYNTCLFPSPGFVLEIQYFGAGTSETCSTLRTVAHPDSPYEVIEVVTCDFEVFSAVGKELLVNCPVPVEQTTWGRVKSLFR